MKKTIYFLILLISLISCAQQPAVLELEFEIPSDLSEVSGMVHNSDGSFWMLQDSGNANILYKINESGQLIQELTLNNHKNTDWEELTSDAFGNLYVGDFGNNKNTRKDLKILKISAAHLTQAEAEATEISFAYPEQQDFPPSKNQMLYDAEAFILFENDFYIFTKNRSKPFDGTSLIYRIPNREGHHVATQIGIIKTCGNAKECAITGAALSPDQKTIALLSHTTIWTLTQFDTKHLFSKSILTPFPLGHNSQKESLSFKNNHSLFIADEVKKDTVGRVYRYTFPTKL